MKTVASPRSLVKSDVTVAQGDKIYVGDIEIEVRDTPGFAEGVFHLLLIS